MLNKKILMFISLSFSILILANEKIPAQNIIQAENPTTHNERAIAVPILFTNVIRLQDGRRIRTFFFRNHQIIGTSSVGTCRRISSPARLRSPSSN